MQGYNTHFLVSNSVEIPDFQEYASDVAIEKITSSNRLDYIYYSVIQSKSRRVPIISASNVYRTHFEVVPRSGNFKIDSRIGHNEQLNTNDYVLLNSLKPATIEKGHMTKREDVQWDLAGDAMRAQNAATSTFFYPNASPQHDSLNNGIWKHLENAIIIKGRVREPAKVSVFTGPVLDKEDPEFKVKLADGSPFQIPVLFWKVVYYMKEDDVLYKAGFLMSQLSLLRRDNLIDDVRTRVFGQTKKNSLKPFLEFREDENYQVPVSLIEELTKLRFQDACDRHSNIKPSILKLNKVQNRNFSSLDIDSFEISNLVI